MRSWKKEKVWFKDSFLEETPFRESPQSSLKIGYLLKIQGIWVMLKAKSSRVLVLNKIPT